MLSLEKLRIQLRMLFHRNRAARQLDEELRFHLDRQIEENRAAGMSPEEARLAALRAFGNPALLRDQISATWSWNWLESLVRDLRYGVRGLRRAPGFSIIAIGTMALGMGVTSALFTVVRSVLLKPLPFQDPDRLLMLYEHSTFGNFPYNQVAPGMFAEWRKQNRTFSGIALCGYAGYNLSGAGEQLPESVRAATFSWNLLPTLGVQPALGRNFTAADDQPSANGTVLLSWGLWKRRFGGSPAILNRTILLDDKPYTVIGVMPAWFAFPQADIQLWTPVYYKEPPDYMRLVDSHDFRVVGRLKAGVTASQAAGDLSLITRRIHDQHLDDPFVSTGANVRPLLDAIVGDMRTPLYVLLGATGCLLLIACLNVANLLVARAAAQRKESAVRAALGGRRLHILRRQLAEALLLAAAGGAGSLVVASGIVQWFVDTRPGMARVEAIHIDGVVAVVAVGLVAVCATLAGLIASFSAWSGPLLPVLQDASRAQSAGHGRVRLRAALLSIEVGLTVVLLMGAGLLLKSYARLRSSDLGCTTRNVLTMNLQLPEARYSEPAQRSNFFAQLLERVRALPGVRAAGLVFPVVPGNGYGGDSGFAVVEHPPLPLGKGVFAIHRWADPGYFAAIGIPFRRGHSFDSNQQPGHLTETVISDAFARQYFPGENPVGKHLRIGGIQSTDVLEIVGVVGDTRSEVDEPPQPIMYFPLLADDEMNGAALVVRSDRDVTLLALPIQRIVARFDRDLPVADILTMDQVVDRNTLDASFDAMLLLAFAALSLLLAAVGLFGVLSYLVAQRTSEIGIRVALGAQREQVLRLMLADGLRPALFGLVIGLVASATCVRVIDSMLYETQPLDPLVFAAVAALLLLVAALACLAPAWRASRLDPMQALRIE